IGGQEILQFQSRRLETSAVREEDREVVAGGGVERIDLPRREIRRLRPGPVAPSLEEQAEVRLRRRQAGIVVQSAPERALRLLQISRLQLERTQVVARLGQAGIVRQGP